MNKVYVVERDEFNGFDGPVSTITGVFTTLKLAEECVAKEEKKIAGNVLSPDLYFHIYEFVLNKGPKDE